jgi:hypothetical protein
MCKSVISDCSYEREDCNKGINNQNGVFSSVTRTPGGQKWSSDPNIVQYDQSCETRNQESLWCRGPAVIY